MREHYEAVWARKIAAGYADQLPNHRVRAALPKVVGSRVLDVGCGEGTLCRLVQERGGSAFGIDVAESALRGAATAGVRACLADLDRHGLPFRSESFDTITALDVVEHIFDPALLLAEIARCLRAGGRAVLTTPNVRYVRHVWRLVALGRGPRTSCDPDGWDAGHLHYFTGADLGDLVKSAGLRLRSLEGVRARDLSRPERAVVAGLGPFGREFLAGTLLAVAEK